MRTGLLVVAIAVCSTACSPPPGTPSGPSPVRTIAGCYRFDTAEFPVIGRDTSTRAVVSFSTSELELLEPSPPPDVVPHAQLPHAVRPIPFGVDPFTVRRWSALSGWRFLSADSVEVTWRNGLFGPVLRLAVRGDSLRGTFEETTDVAGRPPRRRSASAVRIPCPDDSMTRSR